MNRWAYWTALGITFSSAVYSAVLYPFLPEMIPSHWNIHGEVDRFSPKLQGAILMPVVIAGMAALFAVLPWMSPKGFKIDEFRSVYSRIVVGALSLFLYIHVVSFGAAVLAVDVGRAIVVGALASLGWVGNLLGKVRPNFFVGIRTPWTIANERVWTDTHRLAAWLMVGASLIGCALTIAGVSLLAPFGLILVAAFVPVAFSLVYYKRLEARGQIADPQSAGNSPTTSANSVV